MFRQLSISAAAASLVLLVLATACGPNQRIMNSAVEEPTPTTSEPAGPPTFDDDLAAMRNAEFRFIYVFRRKDGEPLSEDDRIHLNSYKPSEVNRARVSDGGRAVIFGSNFRMPPESLKEIGERLIVEDLSTEPQTSNSNDATSQ
ncbi:MAG: hypothetical protein H0V76_12550 [Blastocatellia bacterium]|nr:hypothetical protein [Blastocatellia bacterium]